MRIDACQSITVLHETSRHHKIIVEQPVQRCKCFMANMLAAVEAVAQRCALWISACCHATLRFKQEARIRGQMPEEV